MANEWTDELGVVRILIEYKLVTIASMVVSTHDSISHNPKEFLFVSAIYMFLFGIYLFRSHSHHKVYELCGTLNCFGKLSSSHKFSSSTNNACGENSSNNEWVAATIFCYCSDDMVRARTTTVTSQVFFWLLCAKRNLDSHKTYNNNTIIADDRRHQKFWLFRSIQSNGDISKEFIHSWSVAPERMSDSIGPKCRSTVMCVKVMNGNIW